MKIKNKEAPNSSSNVIQVFGSPETERGQACTPAKSPGYNVSVNHWYFPGGHLFQTLRITFKSGGGGDGQSAPGQLRLLSYDWVWMNGTWNPVRVLWVSWNAPYKSIMVGTLLQLNMTKSGVKLRRPVTKQAVFHSKSDPSPSVIDQNSCFKPNHDYLPNSNPLR